ncbi:hypothetical protein VDGD_09373 [Verticillium dahliae]|nr:hypothetical protein VDGD_09373 [Verticillium dahliae]
MAHADRQRQRAQNNWNAFACDVSEHLLLRTSERIVNLGLRDLGYNTVVLDDCWQDPAGRDAKGKVQPDLAKFPRGMKAISDALHAQNLKFGMYSSAGELTCARFAGSLDHEQDDADSFAAWGVDFLKYDNCFHMGRMGTPEISFNRFKAMSDALKASGRDIALNLCNWGEDYVHTWGASLAHAWRMSGDIYDSFTRPDDLCSCASVADPFCVAPGTQCSVLFILNKVAPFADRAIPGGWNDLDMLEVGRGGMTDEEYKAHFALWAALKSPLMLGSDLRIMPHHGLCRPLHHQQPRHHCLESGPPRPRCLPCPPRHRSPTRPRRRRVCRTGGPHMERPTRQRRPGRHLPQRRRRRS